MSNLSKDTIHIVVKSPYIIQIVKNTNPIELTVVHNVESDSVSIKNVTTGNPDEVNVISAKLSTNIHHDKYDQVVFENGSVRLIIEYQMLYN
ncbi:MAG: hypothetical protein L0H53_03845 [Candidatus Nitrosocosmicus sp.]|nr:hypothetical protein [Candidatus Nitrosocosmicus sp.]MDN5866241.1 hypothetical protein [Candidatus Nitrosocosmicus sp.]